MGEFEVRMSWGELGKELRETGHGRATRGAENQAMSPPPVKATALSPRLISNLSKRVEFASPQILVSFPPWKSVSIVSSPWNPT